MSQGLQCLRYSNDVVVPQYRVDDALELPVVLAPSTSYAKGQLLKQSGSATNDVQTLSVSGTPTGGTIAVGYTNPLTGVSGTFTLAYNSSAAAAQTALGTAFSPGTCTVTGGALPSTPLVFTFSGALAATPVPVLTTTDALTGGSTPASSVAHTTTGVKANTFIKYPGSSGPVSAILPFACQTDAAGQVTISSTSGQSGGQWGQTYDSVPAYFSGYFDTNQLTGYDSNATSVMGKEISNLASGGKLLVVTGA